MMFERGKDLRAAKIAELPAKERREGYEDGLAEGRRMGRMGGRIEDIELIRERTLIRERAKEIDIWALLMSRGVVLPPGVGGAVFGDGGRRGFGARRFRRRVCG